MDQPVDMRFPLAGIDLSVPFAKQRPRKLDDVTGYARTTPAGVNVRSEEVGTDRARGGSRPGLVRQIDARVAGEIWIVQELNTIVTVE